jgi:hypothetical protein
MNARRLILRPFGKLRAQDEVLAKFLMLSLSKHEDTD